MCRWVPVNPKDPSCLPWTGIWNTLSPIPYQLITRPSHNIYCPITVTHIEKLDHGLTYEIFKRFGLLIELAKSRTYRAHGARPNDRSLWPTRGSLRKGALLNSNCIEEVRLKFSYSKTITPIWRFSDRQRKTQNAENKLNRGAEMVETSSQRTTPIEAEKGS